MGGSDDPSNIFECTITEHAELHFSLYLEHGKIEDWIAAQALNGLFSMQGYRHTDETRARMGYEWTDEQRKALSERQRGKKRGRYNNGLTDEERVERRKRKHRDRMRMYRKQGKFP